MSKTKHYGLPIVSWDDGQAKRYKEWWLEINGDAETSAFNLIDEAIYRAAQANGSIDDILGQPDGIASLDTNGLLPVAQLPSHNHTLNNISDIQAIYDYINAQIGEAIGDGY